MPVGGKIYLKRGNHGKRSIRDSRFGMMVGFVICLVFFCACLAGMIQLTIYLCRHAPEKIGREDVIVLREMDYHFGKGQHGTFTVAKLRGEPVAIVGKVEGDGWLLPERDPRPFLKLMSEGERPVIPVREYFQMHPYIYYGFGFVVSGVFLVFAGLTCLSCVAAWRER